jgi:hypothetical protein
MIWQKRFLNLIFSIGLGAGVLFAQICNVVCIAANCAGEEKVVKTETPKPSSHCHQSTPAKSQESEPANDSHHCQTHDLTILLAAADAQSNLSAQVDWQPVAILSAPFTLTFSPQPTARVRLSALRSPPRLPQRQILRI